MPAAVVGERVVFALLAGEALEARAPDRVGVGPEREDIRGDDRRLRVERVAHRFGDPDVADLVVDDRAPERLDADAIGLAHLRPTDRVGDRDRDRGELEDDRARVLAAGERMSIRNPVAETDRRQPCLGVAGEDVATRRHGEIARIDLDVEAGHHLVVATRG